MGVEVILTALSHDLHPTANNIAARELNNRLTSGHIRGLLVFENLITTFAHDHWSFN